MGDSISWTELAAIITPLVALAGIIINQRMEYRKMNMLNAVKEAELHAKLDRIDEKLEAYDKKLDKHNGFEGRILNLESDMKWMKQEVGKSA